MTHPLVDKVLNCFVRLLLENLDGLAIAGTDNVDTAAGLVEFATCDIVDIGGSSISHFNGLDGISTRFDDDSL